MARRRYSPEQIIAKFGEAEVLLSQGMTAKEAVQKLEISERMYYRWRREHGAMRTDLVKRLKKQEREDSRLKKLVAEQALDASILKEASAGVAKRL